MHADVAPGLYQTDFPPDEFAERRTRVYDRIGEAAALIRGAGPVRAFDAFRQTNEFYYLCGVEVPQAFLWLDGEARRTTLLLPRDPQKGTEQPVLSPDDPDLVKRVTGLDEVTDTASLADCLATARTLYVPHRPAEGRQASRDVLQAGDRAAARDPWDGRLTREAHFIGLLQSRYPQLEVRDLSPILDQLRLVKSPREIDMTRRAAALSGLAIMEAMRSTRPGVMEYQLGAVADYIYLTGGTRGAGYRAIIAGGENAWYPHYFANDCPLRDGDLVLMDYAPDCGYYTCDIGRMWPVNGAYSDWQRELYGFMVEYHKALLTRIRPGAMAAQVHEEAAKEMAQVVERTRFSKPIYEAAARKTLEFGGHLSHPVGMTVHDVGSYFDRPLEPGIVFTVDPQLWVPEERKYIRCEDTVVVTEDGIESLTGFVPLEPADVEALMREEGMLQRCPPPDLSTRSPAAP